MSQLSTNSKGITRRSFSLPPEQWEVEQFARMKEAAADTIEPDRQLLDVRSELVQNLGALSLQQLQELKSVADSMLTEEPKE